MTLVGSIRPSKTNIFCTCAYEQGTLGSDTAGFTSDDQPWIVRKQPTK